MNVIRFISLGSICCAGLAILLGIPYSLLLFCNTYSDGLFDTIIYLFRAGLILGIIAVPAVLIARTYWWGLVPAIVSIFICGAVVWIDYEITMYSRDRQETLKKMIGDYNLRLLGEELIENAKANSGRLPEAAHWCDSLMKDNNELTEVNFRHPNPDVFQLKGECHFAFNKNLSGLQLADIPGDVVLLFEADGDWNLNGAAELLQTRYREHGYIAVLTVDGKMWKYWFDMNALKKFDKDGTSMYYEQPRWQP